MKGFRTLVATAISAVVAPWLANHIGLTLTPDQQAATAAAVVAGVAWIMRFMTTTPVFQSTTPNPPSTPTEKKQP